MNGELNFEPDLYCGACGFQHSDGDCDLDPENLPPQGLWEVVGLAVIVGGVLLGVAAFGQLLIWLLSFVLK